MLKTKITLLLCLCFPVGANAQGQPEFSLNTWMSDGQTKWRHDASALDPELGVPSSELDYQNVNSNVVEVSMSETLPAGHYIKLSIGTGQINSGLLVDDDYLSAYGAVVYSASESGNHRFSRTHSDIDGSYLLYLNGKLSPREFGVISDRYSLKFNLSFHYWYEEYKANGVRQVECTTLSLCDPAGTSGYAGVTVISNTVEWMGAGAGLDFDLNLFANFYFYFNYTFYPLMSLNNEDTHHLRPDLAQDPSISMSGTGTGQDLITGLKIVAPSKKASIYIGYRSWQRHVTNQTITFHGASGGSASADLMDFKTTRDGLIAGVSLRF